MVKNLNPNILGRRKKRKKKINSEVFTHPQVVSNPFAVKDERIIF